jgi:UDP-glucose 4-epimerase
MTSKKILFASTSEVYGSAEYVRMDEKHPLLAKHPYGVSKIAADRLCSSHNKTYGLGVDIIRSFYLFGPWQKNSGYGGVIGIFIKRVLQNKPPIIYGDGTQTRDYMFIADAVNAYDMVLVAKNNPGRNGINFGSGIEISINKIAELVIKNVAVKEMNVVHVQPRPIEVQRLFADISKSQRFLKFKPQIEFENGLRILVDWYNNYKSELWTY